MSNQSPAEALRDEASKFCYTFKYNDLPPSLKVKVDKFMELVTAYAATVEREAATKAKMQMKANVFVQFKNAMAAQSLSPPPQKGTRFRTPLEELLLILEREAPLSDLAALQGPINERKEDE